jgi:hypothetical protein
MESTLRGPTSAAESTGERCQRTTSMRAAEPIRANGIEVARADETTSSANGRRVVPATAAETKRRLSAYCVVAEIATADTIAAVPEPSTKETSTAAAPAPIANTDALKATRSSGLCSSSCTIAGAANAISTPASQPKRTMPLAPKTNDRVTPPLSAPSIGTG